jgi:hypothetical protein
MVVQDGGKLRDADCLLHYFAVLPNDSRTFGCARSAPAPRRRRGEYIPGPATIPTEYVTRQSTRIIANGHRDYRADSITQTAEFPYPFTDPDNTMLEYLIRKARELEEEEGQPSYLWLAVHAWYEGALQTMASTPGTATE